MRAGVWKDGSSISVILAALTVPADRHDHPSWVRSAGLRRACQVAAQLLPYGVGTGDALGVQRAMVRVAEVAAELEQPAWDVVSAVVDNLRAAEAGELPPPPVSWRAT